jgi:alkylation response protein AidB-like acyl-CoA dehydrogenase
VADFDVYQLTEEHAAIRTAVPDICEAKVAPNAAVADETGEFPVASYEALRAADFHAPHVPVEYGGAGADALATAIVIEEVARVCAASSLIPAVDKLGTLPLLLAGSDDIKRRYLPPVARGEAMFSYCLSEPGAGSDAAAMSTKAVRDGDHFVLNGAKRWIANAGVSEFYTVFAVTDPSARSRGISAFVVERSDAGVSFGAPERKLGIKGSPTREVYLDDVRVPADRMIGSAGTGFATAMRTLDHTRVTIAAQAVGIAQGAVDYARRYVTLRTPRRRPHVFRRGGQVLRIGRGDGDHHRRRTAARWVRLHEGLPARADDARRQDYADLRGYEPGAAHRDGTASARRSEVAASYPQVRTRRLSALAGV